MRKNLLKNLKAALAYLSVLLLSIFVAEKIGRLFIFGYIFKAALIILFLVSVYMNRNAFMHVKKNYLRYSLIAILCLSITMLLGYISLVIAVNFNLAIGGGL